MTVPPATIFSLPQGRQASMPPEHRGLTRDEVKLLVAGPGGIAHTTFRHLADHLESGDVVVVNTSATRPAAIDATWRGKRITLHLSTHLAGDRWVVELRRDGGGDPIFDATAGDRVLLAGGARAELISPYSEGMKPRLWEAGISTKAPLDAHMDRHGRPISYGYVEGSWPLEIYQTVFARPDDPTGASAEMPSAGRPFTPELVTTLVSQGISVVPITLHTGVSSLERDEPPYPERFVVPPATASAARAARRRGGRLVAVGTTVTRALETVADTDGFVWPGEGWTDLVLGPGRPARAVTGLVTGWHPPEASHLHVLEAVVGARLVGRAYAAALAGGYLWHEFGDSCLLLA
ncbi:MAG TPA: S-adenosylmethionine:tRNA ribosyltransferase-isomerase [Acidimicrobiia bacterium]|nr:S-adenosylmethionine:tRNA ribosyltransferase-isomerase [Acidimicrobiia bacterium]